MGKYEITIKDTETGDERTIKVDGYVLGKVEKELSGELDYTVVYEGVDKGNLAFINKMLDVELTQIMLEMMGVL